MSKIDFSKEYYEQLQKKQEEEVKKAQAKIDRKKKDFEMVIELIDNDLLVYKERNTRRHQLVTHELFKEHYFEEGVSVYNEGFEATLANGNTEYNYSKYPSVEVNVNGHRYYSINQMTSRYVDSIVDYKKRIQRLYDDIKESEKKLSELVKDLENFKPIIQEYETGTMFKNERLRQLFEKEGKENE